MPDTLRWQVYGLRVLTGFLLCVGAAEGATDEQKLVEMLVASRWSLGPEVSSFHYDEPGIMEEDGTLFGVSAAYTRYLKGEYETALFRLEGGFSAGEADYDGALMNGTPHRMYGNDEYLLNVRALYGPVWRDGMRTNHLYFGLGYRYLQDDSSVNPHGYRRHSNYLYVPLGVRRDYILCDRWYLGLGGEIDVLIAGLQISEIPESEDDPSHVENWQFPGIGARGTLELRYRTDSLDLSLAPFVQYWLIDDSQPSSSGRWYEPWNWSLQYGLGLVWRF